LLEAFHRRTSCPMLINTSFNVRDEPIVCSPKDAIRCFENANLDVLAIGKFLVLREQIELPSNLQTVTLKKTVRSQIWAAVAMLKRALVRFGSILQIPFVVLAQAIMLAVYWVVISPIGFLRKRRGQLKIDVDADRTVESYWISREHSQDMQSHFRQS
ncbi:MAG: carbamoyltransferase C-terminal domain-containing protein, partial [Pirellula sp.]